MKSVKAWVGTMLVVIMIMMTSAAADAAEVTGGVDFVSAYVWRGITFNDGLVAQPSMDVSAGGFNFNVWGNLDIGDYGGRLDEGEFSEIDLALSYTADAGPISITGGYIEYLFPTTETGGALGTREIYLDVSGHFFDNLAIGVVGFYDIDEVEDYYLSPYIGYSLSLNQSVFLDLGASVGYAGSDFAIGGNSGFHEYTLYLGAGYQVGRASLNAMLGYTDTLDTDVLPEGREASDVNFFGGLGIFVSL